jgi:hypothetical protein
MLDITYASQVSFNTLLAGQRHPAMYGFPVSVAEKAVSLVYKPRSLSITRGSSRPIKHPKEQI